MVEKHYVLVTKNSCPHCKEAIELLKSKNSSFIYTDMENAKQVLEETKKQSDWETVPMIWEQLVDWSNTSQQVLSSQFIGGYEDLQNSLNEND
jgi:glutaredoxin